jgi:cobyrinic acid a,c-diamide synthase
MAIVIAAASSDAGKTTITLAILAALRQRGLRIQSFKVGPDYIDPMFHQAATGIACRNLDPFLTSESYVRQCFRHHSQGKDGVVIEGVMGLFDGTPQAEQVDFASTAHMARLLDCPIVLVINGAKIGHSVAALLYGLIHYDPRLTIAGVILNQVGSPRHAEILQGAVQSLGLPCLGTFFRTPDISLPSRHLGLVPVGELAGFAPLLDRLACLAETALDWDLLHPLIRQMPEPDAPPWSDLDPSTIEPLQSSRLQIGVAWDRACNFYYADTLDLLRWLGAELHFFSPLQVGLAPSQTLDGLYLGGGFPEIFARELSQSLQRSFHKSQMPIYAECGGLIMLGETLTNQAGESYPMAGRLPLQTKMTSKLTLGYRRACSLRPTIVVEANDRFNGHEFHHCQSLPTPTDPIYTWSGRQEGWTRAQIHASYLHLHWGAQPELGIRYLQACVRARELNP